MPAGARFCIDITKMAFLDLGRKVMPISFEKKTNGSQTFNDTISLLF
jgi:hypothetical protein